jgi:hypothetical protein
VLAQIARSARLWDAQQHPEVLERLARIHQVPISIIKRAARLNG